MLKPVAPAPLPIRLLGRTVDWVVIGIGAVMATMVFINVCLHLFHKDLAWVTEFGELLMVWVTFLGGACAAQRGAHMTITEFIDKLGPAQAPLGRPAPCSRPVWRCCWCWCATAGRWSMPTGATSSPCCEWPMALQYMGMAVGCSLMALFVAWDVWQIARGVPRETRYPKSE